MTEQPTQFDRANWLRGSRDLERLPNESTPEYLERLAKHEAENDPLGQRIEPPKETPRMPYVDREPGSDDGDD